MPKPDSEPSAARSAKQATSAHKIDFAALPWDTPAPGARMKLHKGADADLRLLELTSGFVEADWCLRGHVGYVLRGRMEVDFDGTVETFAAGDGLFIPPGEAHRHKATVLTDSVLLILVEAAAEPEDGARPR